MKKLLAILTLVTSISGMSATNINVNPVINFNPNINVTPTITSNNDNTNTNTNDNKSSLKVDKLHSESTAKPAVVKVLKKLQEVDKKMTALEKKEVNFEALAKNFGKEKESQDLLKAAKAKIEADRKKLVEKSVGLIKEIKKVEGSKKKGVIIFKTKRIEREFETLKKKNPALVNILIETSNMLKTKFDKPLVLTHIFRTQAEQHRFYGGHTNKKSWHQFNAAADFRSRIFTPVQIVQIVSFLKKWEKTNALRLTILYHNIGLGKHFHLQYKAKK